MQRDEFPSWGWEAKDNSLSAEQREWVREYESADEFPAIPERIASAPPHDRIGINPFTGQLQLGTGQMAYDNTNTGALFKAKERATDKHPEYSGTINVDGKEYWLAGWVNEAKSGQKYFSLKVKAKDKQPEREERMPKHFEDMKGDIPF